MCELSLALKLDHHFTEVVAAEQTQESINRIIHAFDHGLAALYPAFLDPAHHVFQKLLTLVAVVRNYETVDANLFADNEHQVIWAGNRLGIVIRRNHAAGRDAAKGVDDIQRRLQMVAAHILEEDIDAFWRRICRFCN